MRKHYGWQLVVLVLGAIGSAALLSRTQGQSPPAPPPPRQLPADLAPAGFVPPAADAPASKALTQRGRAVSQFRPRARGLSRGGRRGSEWLSRLHQPPGRFVPGWLPALNQPAEGDHFLRQAGAALALARAARFFKDERYTARAR